MAVDQEGVSRERRHAARQERLVGGAGRPEDRRVRLTRRRGNHGAAVAFQFRARVAAVVGRGAFHPGRVDVVVGEPAFGEVGEEGIGIPGRAAVAAVRVAGPPAEPHRPLQVRPLLPESLGHLQHAGIAGGVVGDAFVPGAIVSADQDEPFGLARPGNAHLGELRAIPAGLEPSGHDRRHRRARLQEALQRPAGLDVHRDRGDRGHAVDLIELRRAPDRGADHVVDEPVFVGEDNPDATGLAGLQDRHRRRESVHECNPAPGVAELRVLDQDELGSESVRASGSHEGMRDL